MPAGFYYKTFMWPKSFWYRVYEPFIRKAAGLGVASTKHDKERYEHKYEYCDLLITDLDHQDWQAHMLQQRMELKLF